MSDDWEEVVSDWPFLRVCSVSVLVLSWTGWDLPLFWSGMGAKGVFWKADRVTLRLPFYHRHVWTSQALPWLLSLVRLGFALLLLFFSRSRQAEKMFDDRRQILAAT